VRSSDSEQDDSNVLRGNISKHLAAFGSLALREIARGDSATFFFVHGARLAYPTILKLRDTRSSIIRYAIDKGGRQNRDRSFWRMGEGAVPQELC